MVFNSHSDTVCLLLIMKLLKGFDKISTRKHESCKHYRHVNSSGVWPVIDLCDVINGE